MARQQPEHREGSMGGGQDPSIITQPPAIMATTTVQLA